MVKIIAVNAGSSSLKFQLLEAPEYHVILSGLIEKIGLPGASMTLKRDGRKETFEHQIPDHQVAVKLLLEALVSQGVVDSLEEIKAIGHRVVHGGELYHASLILTDEVAQEIKSISDLAPLHNPANLTGYYSFRKALPGATHVAVFDTAFHQTMKPDHFLYPIPMEYYRDYKIRRYGFHGTSHRYVSMRAIDMLGNPKHSRIVTLHLGNGASLAAVRDGVSINTSMGFTPLSGIMMGTRSGDVDPAIVTFLAWKLGVRADEVVSILNKKSGFLGISELSPDARVIEDACNEGHEGALLARSIYANLIAQRVGSYLVDLGGLDAIVFTAGLGENDDATRQAICDLLAEPLGIILDPELNKLRGGERVVSTPDSKVKIFVIPTDEELMIVKDTYELVFGGAK